jgi:hypothetical protein
MYFHLVTLVVACSGDLVAFGERAVMKPHKRHHASVRVEPLKNPNKFA